jgi:hypothetical protein
MHRKSKAVCRGSSLLLLVTVYISPVRAVDLAAAAPTIQLADGTWTVQGRAIQGTRRCGDWLVRLTNAGGQLSGVVSLARSSVPIKNLTLQPDGSFTGATRAGVVGTTHVRPYRISGRFSGDSVSLTLKDNMCPPRQGTAVRQAARG